MLFVACIQDDRTFYARCAEEPSHESGCLDAVLTESSACDVDMPHVECVMCNG